MLHHALIWTFMVMQAELLCKHNFDSELVLLRYPQSQLYLFNISRRVRACLGISMNSKLFRKFFDETYNLVASITLHPSLCFVTTCILLLCRANVHSSSVNSANFIRLKLMESFVLSYLCHTLLERNMAFAASIRPHPDSCHAFMLCL